MCPDVTSLGVDAEYRPEAGREGGKRWPVAPQQIVIILKPVWKCLEVANFPWSFNHFATDLSSLACRPDCYVLGLSGHIRAETCCCVQAPFNLNRFKGKLVWGNFWLLAKTELTICLVAEGKSVRSLVDWSILDMRSVDSLLLLSISWASSAVLRWRSPSSSSCSDDAIALNDTKNELLGQHRWWPWFPRDTHHNDMSTKIPYLCEAFLDATRAVVCGERNWGRLSFS